MSDLLFGSILRGRHVVRRGPVFADSAPPRSGRFACVLRAALAPGRRSSWVACMARGPGPRRSVAQGRFRSGLVGFVPAPRIGPDESARTISRRASQLAIDRCQRFGERPWGGNREKQRQTLAPESRWRSIASGGVNHSLSDLHQRFIASRSAAHGPHADRSAAHGVRSGRANPSESCPVMADPGTPSTLARLEYQATPSRRP